MKLELSLISKGERSCDYHAIWYCSLCGQLPDMFAERKIRDVILEPAIRAGMEALKVHTLYCVLPSLASSIFSFIFLLLLWSFFYLIFSLSLSFYSLLSLSLLSYLCYVFSLSLSSSFSLCVYRLQSVMVN